MSYDAVQRMSQYYREMYYLALLDFPDAGKLPPDVLKRLVSSWSPIDVVESMYGLDTGLPDNQDQALRLMLVTLTQANMQHSERLGQPEGRGADGRLSPALILSIKNGLAAVLNLHPAKEYIAIAAQVLYFIGEIDDMLALLGKVPDIVESTPVLQAMLAFTHMMAEEYTAALPYLNMLVEKEQENKYPCANLVVMTCLYKLGGVPEFPIDFSLPESITLPDLNWLIAPGAEPRHHPTAVIACNDKYFFEHALALVYSIHATNAGQMYVHLHLYQPDQAMRQRVSDLCSQFPELKITATIDHKTRDASSPYDTVYFACERFVVIAQLLDIFNAPVISLDADSLLRHNWAQWREQNGLHAPMLVQSTANVPIWAKIIAPFLYLEPNDAVRAFIQLAAVFIEHNLRQGNYVWFLDQIALTVAFENTLQAISPPSYQMHGSLVDVRHIDASALTWSLTAVKDLDNAYSRYKAELLSKFGQ